VKSLDPRRIPRRFLAIGGIVVSLSFAAANNYQFVEGVAGWIGLSGPAIGWVGVAVCLILLIADYEIKLHQAKIERESNSDSDLRQCLLAGESLTSIEAVLDDSRKLLLPTDASAWLASTTRILQSSGFSPSEIESFRSAHEKRLPQYPVVSCDGSPPDESYAKVWQETAAKVARLRELIGPH
jgi:hypothetical protein